MSPQGEFGGENRKMVTQCDESLAWGCTGSLESAQEEPVTQNWGGGAWSFPEVLVLGKT